MTTRRMLLAAAAALVLVMALTGCLGGGTPTTVIETVEVEKVVEVERVVTATPEPTSAAPAATAIPTQTPTATPTPNPLDQEVADLTVGELLQLLGSMPPEVVAAATITQTQPVTQVFATQWFTATNVPTSVETIKQNPSGCNMPDEVCYMVDEEGVLGADDYQEAMANESAIWTGSAWHQMSDQKTFGTLVPEGSYLTAYAAGMIIEGGGYTLEFPPCGELCAVGFLARGWFAETRSDRHVPVTITNLGEPGMIYTRYTVPVHAAQFFSQDYLTEQARNAYSIDNCGIEDDCTSFVQYVFDYNDGSLTALTFHPVDGWEVLWTNVQPSP